MNIHGNSNIRSRGSSIRDDNRPPPPPEAFDSSLNGNGNGNGNRANSNATTTTEHKKIHVHFRMIQKLIRRKKNLLYLLLLLLLILTAIIVISFPSIIYGLNGIHIEGNYGKERIKNIGNSTTVSHTSQNVTDTIPFVYEEEKEKEEEEKEEEKEKDNPNHTDAETEMEIQTNKPTLIIHIGPPKTGSTTLQCTLESLRPQLEKDNIVYIGRPECTNANPPIGQFGSNSSRCSGQTHHQNPTCIC